MRNISLSIALLLSIMFAGCEDNSGDYSPRYPFIITMDPILSGDSVKFCAQIKEYGVEEIRSYGFIWDNSNVPNINPGLNYSEYIELGIVNGNSFSYSISKDQLNSSKYYLKAFLNTDSYNVYANEKTFTK